MFLSNNRRRANYYHGKPQKMRKMLHVALKPSQIQSRPLNLTTFSSHIFLCTSNVAPAGDSASQHVPNGNFFAENNEVVPPKPTDSDVVDQVCRLLRHNQWASLENMVPRLTPPKVSAILAIYSEEPRVALEFFLWVGMQRGFQHTVESYCVTIDILSRSRLRTYAWALLQRLLMRSSKDFVLEAVQYFVNKCGNLMVLDMLIGSLARAKMFDEVIAVFNVIGGCGICPSIRSYCNLLRSLKEEGLFSDFLIPLGQEGTGNGHWERHRDRLRKDFDWKDKGRAEMQRMLSGLGVCRRLRYEHYCKGGRDSLESMHTEGEMGLGINDYVVESGSDFSLRKNESIEAVFARDPRPRYNAIIGSLCREGKVRLAFGLQNEMVEKGIRPNISTYNALMNGLCKLGHVEGANELLKDIVEMGLYPNSATYNTLMGGHCKRGEMEKALGLAYTMVKSGVQPNLITCNILMNGLCKGGKMEEAKKLLIEMWDQHKLPDLVTSTILIHGYCTYGNMQEALELWYEMLRRGVVPDTFAYNVLINGFCLDGNMRYSSKLYGQIIKTGLTPDIITYNTLIDGFCRESDFQEACRIYDGMLNAGLVPDLVSYKILIRGLCKHGDIGKANSYFQQMLCSNVIPDHVIFNTLIDAHIKEGNTVQALRLRDKMVALGLMPNVFTYNALIHGCAKEGNIQEAFRLKHEMLAGGLIPDVVTYNLLIYGLCKSRQVSEALVLHEEMVSKGLVPDKFTYTELILGLCKKGKTEEAHGLLMWMQRNDLCADNIAYNILIRRYCMEEAVSNDTKEKGVKFINLFLSNKI